MPYFRISGINVLVNGPSWVIYSNLHEFEYDQLIPDVSCNVLFDTIIFPDLMFVEKILDNGEKAVFISNEKIFMTDKNPLIPYLIEASKDWSEISIHIEPKYICHDDPEFIDLVQCLISDSLKFIISVFVTLNGGILIHSASIIYNEKGIVFSAPSGTGKTTHISMWCEKYGVKVLDGDITSCRIFDGTFRVYGLPWCGSSGRFINDSVPLGAIIFIEQDLHNTITKLNNTEAIVRLYTRSYLYVWDEKTADMILETLTSIVSSTDCFLLKCRPDFEAVEIAKRCLEKE